MRRIRVAVDGSRTSGHALAWAAEQAREHGAVLEVATVFGGGGRPLGERPGIPAERDPEEVVVERQVAVLDEHVPDRDGLDVRHAVLLGQVAEQLVRAEPAPDLLVMGTRGVGGFVGLLVGSTAHQVVEHATCPVVVVPDTDEPPAAPERIVVGVDGTEASRRAVAWAADEARARGGSLHLVAAYTSNLTPPEPLVAPSVLVEPEAIRRSAEQVAIGALAELDTETLRATWGAVDGRPHRVLLDRAEQADLLVLGAPGLHVGPMHLGSVAHLLLKHARIPVAVVR